MTIYFFLTFLHDNTKIMRDTVPELSLYFRRNRVLFFAFEAKRFFAKEACVPHGVIWRCGKVREMSRGKDFNIRRPRPNYVNILGLL